MAQEDKPLSPEAEARKTIDDLKGKLATATEALEGTSIHSRLVQSFASQGHKNPSDLASRAQSQFQEVTSETTEDALNAQAKVWFDQERAMFGGEPSDDPVVPETPTQPDTPLSTLQPNLTAAGLQPQTVAVVIGSKEYYEQGWDQRSTQEQVNAMKGDNPSLVSSEKVRTQQQEISPFG